MNYLATYLNLEKEMVRFDEAEEEDLAEAVREIMDVIWREKLSAEEIEALNSGEYPPE